MTEALATEIADEHLRYAQFVLRQSARELWHALGLPPQGYVSWRMVRREMIHMLMYRQQWRWAA